MLVVIFWVVPTERQYQIGPKKVSLLASTSPRCGFDLTAAVFISPGLRRYHNEADGWRGRRGEPSCGMAALPWLCNMWASSRCWLMAIWLIKQREEERGRKWRWEGQVGCRPVLSESLAATEEACLCIFITLTCIRVYLCERETQPVLRFARGPNEGCLQCNERCGHTMQGGIRTTWCSCWLRITLLMGQMLPAPSGTTKRRKK